MCVVGPGFKNHWDGRIESRVENWKYLTQACVSNLDEEELCMSNRVRETCNFPTAKAAAGGGTHARMTIKVL